MKAIAILQVIFAAVGRWLLLTLLFHLMLGFCAGFSASFFSPVEGEKGTVTGLAAALTYGATFRWLPAFLAAVITGFFLRRSICLRARRCATALPLAILMAFTVCPVEASAPESALRAMEQGQAAEALRILEAEPESVLLLRLRAVCLMELRRDAEAERLLRRALGQDPGNVACRFYLAQALAQQGKIQPSLNLLRELAADPQAAGSDYAAQAAALVPQLSALLPAGGGEPPVAQSPAKRWRALLQAAMEYDDNPAEVADRPAPGQSKNGSFRFTSGAYVDVHLIDQYLDEAPLTWGAAYAFYGSTHFRHEASDQDLLHHTGEIFLQRYQDLGSFPALFSLASGYTYDELSGRQFAETIHLVGETSIRWSGWVSTALALRSEWVDFEQGLVNPSLYSRDGLILSPRLRQSFHALEGRWTLWAEYQYEWSDSNGSQFVEESHQAALGSEFDLPWSLRWHLSYRYRHSLYPEFLPQPEREDHVHLLTTSLSRPLFTDGLRAELRFTRMMSDSNVAFAEYTRNIWGVGLRYEF